MKMDKLTVDTEPRLIPSRDRKGADAHFKALFRAG